MLNDRYTMLFGPKPVFGMIHLAGVSPIERAAQELEIFASEGVDAAIVENYHGPVNLLPSALEKLSTLNTGVVLGVNVLPNDFENAFLLANAHHACFIQVDHVAGTYRGGRTLNIVSYTRNKMCFPHIAVLGGVWPKYYDPIGGSNLTEDLEAGMIRAEAIVVTGEGTGKETPLEKIVMFREVLGDHPLIVGAGATPENIYEVLQVADGVIVGSSLKTYGETQQPIDRGLVQEFMAEVRRARENSV